MCMTFIHTGLLTHYSVLVGTRKEADAHFFDVPKSLKIDTFTDKQTNMKLRNP